MKKPHVLADPTSASAANNKTLSDFFTAVGQQSVANVLALFSLDIGNPPTIPGVGITSHGPNFEGHADITVLFTRLFASFPDLTLKELNNAPRLYSLNSYTGLATLGVQTTLKGTFQSAWFAKQAGVPDIQSHYSKPLSDVVPQNGNFQKASIPAFCVFLLDANSLISQLSVYLDRYRFESDLKPTVG